MFFRDVHFTRVGMVSSNHTPDIYWFRAVYTSEHCSTAVNVPSSSPTFRVFGIITTQVFTYYRRYPSDTVAYKLLVIGIWLLEAVDQAFIGHSIYYYTITNFSSPLTSIIGKIPWSLILQVTLGALVGAIVKICFALRVWRFSHRNVPVTATLLSLIIVQLGLAFVYTVKAFSLTNLLTVSKLKVIGTLSLGAGVLTDVLTAVALCFYLRKLRTGYEKIDTLANKLMLYAVNTGILTSALSLCTLILYNLMPDNMVFMGFYFVLSKLYAISFMTTLNTRRVARGRGTDRGAGNYMLDRTDFTQAQSQTKSQLEVGVHQEISVVSDFLHSPLSSKV